MKTYGLIGEHLSHSFSKEIHESIADYRYDLIPLDKEAFCSFMEDRDFAAVNVTIPYKKAVIPYLDELDEAAQAIGAVNTVVNRDGKLYGYNTDYTGFQYMVRKHGVRMNGKKVLIIGNGGASAAVQAVVRHEGAAQMVIVDIVEGNGAISYEECYRSHLDAQVIINTSPVGMYPHGDAAPVDLERFARCEAVMDVIYNPLMSRLCQQARKRGLVHVNGLEMLVAQAKQAVEHFAADVRRHRKAAFVKEGEHLAVDAQAGPPQHEGGNGEPGAERASRSRQAPDAGGQLQNAADDPLGIGRVQPQGAEQRAQQRCGGRQHAHHVQQPDGHGEEHHKGADVHDGCGR